MNNANKVIKTIYDTYIKMLELSDELNVMQKAYNSRMLNQEKEYEGKLYNEMQYKEIMDGLNDGLDVSLYASPDLSYMSMSMIRAAIQSGADVKEIVNPDKRFDEKQIALLCSAAVSGLYDVEKIAYPHLDADRMLARISGDYIFGEADKKEAGIGTESILNFALDELIVTFESDKKAMLSMVVNNDYFVMKDKYSLISEIVREGENEKTYTLQRGTSVYRILFTGTNVAINVNNRFESDMEKTIETDYKIFYEEVFGRAKGEFDPIGKGLMEYAGEDAVREVFSNLKTGSYPNSVYKTLADTYEKYGKNPTRAEELILGFNNKSNKEKHSEKREKTFAEQVDEVLAGISNQYNALKVCDTPDILIQVGCEQLPILYTQSHLKEAIKPKNGHTHTHGLEIEQLKRIPVLLEEPVMIMDSVSRNDSIVVVTSEVDRDNCPVIVSIHPNGRGNYEMENVDSNFITSIYGRENFGSFLERVVQTNNLLFCDKVKSQELFSCQGLQSSEAINNLDYDVIIHHSHNIINTKVNKNEEKNATLPKSETKATTKKTIR